VTLLTARGESMAIDMFFAVLIFVLASSSIMWAWTNKAVESETLLLEGEMGEMAENALDRLVRTQGTPYDWETSPITDLQEPGLAKRDMVLEEEKVNALLVFASDITSIEYRQIRQILLIGANDFYFRLVDPTAPLGNNTIRNSEETLIEVGVRPIDIPHNAVLSTARRTVVFTYQRAGDLEPRQHEAIAELTLYTIGIIPGTPSEEYVCITDGECNGDSCPLGCDATDDPDCAVGGCCGDATCVTGEICAADCDPETQCQDSTDNDEDGDPDCDDSDCAAEPECAPPVEICDNTIDDDGDTDVDCDDSDCFAAANCIGANLILELKLDEGTGTTTADETGNGNNGTLTNGPIWQTADCISGNCVSFDGADDWIDIGYPGITFTAGTIMAWAKIESGASGEGGILDLGTNGEYFEIMYSGGGIRADVDDDALCGREWISNVSSNYDDDTWHHIAATFIAQDTLRLYIDGVEQGTGASLAGCKEDIVPTAEWKVGKFYLGSLLGWIDEVKVYNYALTREEIQAKYDAEKPKDLIMELKMDEGAGGTAADNSGNGNDGTLIPDEATGPQWQTTPGDCPSGNCLLFDGVDDYIDVGVPSQLDLIENYTIAAWIYIEVTIGEYNNIIKRSQGATNTDRFQQYCIEMVNDDLRFTTGDGTVADEDIYSDVIPEKQWTHIACTLDLADNKVCYVNGVQVGSETNDISNPGALTSTVGFIGTRSIGGRQLNGKIDELKVYNGAMNSTEIQALYEAEKPQELVMELKMDEGSGTTAADTTGNGNDGTLTNEPIWQTTDCISGNCLSFDGLDDSIVFSNAQGTDLDITSSVTISAWIKPAAIDRHQVIFAKGRSRSSAANEQYVLTMNTSEQLIFLVSDGINEPAVASPSQSFVADEWYHVVGTFDADGATNPIKVYINGVEENSVSAPFSTLQSTTSEVGIAADVEDAKDYFIGLIDEVKMYNYALDSTEIQALYEAEKPAGLVMELKMDEGSGTTTADSAGTNDGTLVNGPTWETNCVSDDCVNLDGTDDYVEVANDTSINTDSSKPISLSFWMKPGQELNSEISRIDILAKRDNYWIIYNISGNGELYFWLGNNHHIEYADNFSAGIWQHISATKDETGYATLYVNGELKAEGDLSAATYDSTYNLYFGNSQNNSNNFNGGIDEVKIWDRSISNDYICQLCNADATAVGVTCNC